MTRTAIAAIDQGTTSTRCILFDAKGQSLGTSQLEHKQIFPQPGWVEHDALEIWRATSQVIRESRLAAGPDVIVAAIGITNQRETLVVWNPKSGRPYLNAIVWQDLRTQATCDELAGEAGPGRFRGKTGLPLAPYFTGPKLRWALKNTQGLREAALRGEAICGTIDSWLIWNLTGGPNGGAHVTDVTNASRTMWMNLETLDWDPELLEAFGVPAPMLPRIVPTSDPEPWGHTLDTGPFGATIPVCAAAGDQQAALIGQCCFEVGEAKNTYGTGCFLLLNTGEKAVVSKAGLLTTVAYRFGDAAPRYALEGSVAIGGSLIQWLRDNLGLIKSANEVEELARSVDDTAGAYIVPAFSGLFAPHWRSDARGVICGLTSYVTKAHLVRAALEATALQVHDVLDAMTADSGIELSELRVDGGMARNDLLLQIQADMNRSPVVRPTVIETTALGAAYAAGLAVDFFDSPEGLRRNWRQDRRFEPHLGEDARAEKLRGWRKALDRSWGWVD